MIIGFLDDIVTLEEFRYYYRSKKKFKWRKKRKVFKEKKDY